MAVATAMLAAAMCILNSTLNQNQVVQSIGFNKCLINGGTMRAIELNEVEPHSGRQLFFQEALDDPAERCVYYHDGRLCMTNRHRVRYISVFNNGGTCLNITRVENGTFKCYNTSGGETDTHQPVCWASGQQCLINVTNSLDNSSSSSELIPLREKERVLNELKLNVAQGSTCGRRVPSERIQVCAVLNKTYDRLLSGHSYVECIQNGGLTYDSIRPAGTLDGVDYYIAYESFGAFNLQCQAGTVTTRKCQTSMGEKKLVKLAHGWSEEDDTETECVSSIHSNGTRAECVTKSGAKLLTHAPLCLYLSSMCIETRDTKCECGPTDTEDLMSERKKYFECCMGQSYTVPADLYSVTDIREHYTWYLPRLYMKSEEWCPSKRSICIPTTMVHIPDKDRDLRTCDQVRLPFDCQNDRNRVCTEYNYKLLENEYKMSFVLFVNGREYPRCLCRFRIHFPFTDDHPSFRPGRSVVERVDFQACYDKCFRDKVVRGPMITIPFEHQRTAEIIAMTRMANMASQVYNNSVMVDFSCWSTVEGRYSMCNSNDFSPSQAGYPYLGYGYTIPYLDNFVTAHECWGLGTGVHICGVLIQRFYHPSLTNSWVDDGTTSAGRSNTLVKDWTFAQTISTGTTPFRRRISLEPTRYINVFSPDTWGSSQHYKDIDMGTYDQMYMKYIDNSAPQLTIFTGSEDFILQGHQHATVFVNKNRIPADCYQDCKSHLAVDVWVNIVRGMTFPILRSRGNRVVRLERSFGLNGSIPDGDWSAKSYTSAFDPKGSVRPYTTVLFNRRTPIGCDTLFTGCTPALGNGNNRYKSICFLDPNTPAKGTMSCQSDFNIELIPFSFTLSRDGTPWKTIAVATVKKTGDKTYTYQLAFTA